MAPPSKPQPASRRAPRRQLYATHSQLQAVLAIIERNTKRIERLEDVFALQVRERVQVNEDLAALKAVHKRKRARRR